MTSAVTPMNLERPPARRRWMKRLGLFVVVFALIVGFLPLIVAKSGLVRSLVSTSTKSLQGEVQFASVSLGWFSPIEISGLVVNDASGKTLLQAESVVTSKTLLSFLTDRSELGTISIHGLRGELVCDREGTNFEKLFRKSEHPEPSEHHERAPLTVVIDSGVVAISEPNGPVRELQIDNFTLSLPGNDSQPTVMKLQGKSGGPIDLALELGKTNSAQLQANQFQLDTLAPVIKRFTTDSVGGQLSSQLKSNWSGGTLSLEGTASLAEARLAGPTFGPEPITLKSIELPCKFTRTGERLTIDAAELKTDFGSAKVSGEFAGFDEKALEKGGLKLQVDLDLARCAAVAPKLLRLKTGTELSEGKLHASLESKQEKEKVTWAGSLTTSDIRGQRDGKPLVWKNPLKVKFLGRLRPDRLPDFDHLEASADFVGLAARGNPDDFVVKANIKLDPLADQLSQFVDLGMKLHGSATIDAEMKPEGDKIRARGKLVGHDLEVTTTQGKQWKEEVTHFEFDLLAAKPIEGRNTIHSAYARLVFCKSNELVSLTLKQPISNGAFHEAVFDAGITGDWSRLQSRVALFAEIPKDWTMSGFGSAQANVSIDPTQFQLSSVSVLSSPLRFQGAGISLDERTLYLASHINYQRKSGELQFRDVKLKCDTAELTSDQLQLVPAENGAYKTAGKVAITRADMGRLQRTLQLQSAPDGSDLLQGIARGSAGFEAAPTGTRFVSDLHVDQFAFGSPKQPLWTEPWVKIATEGEIDGAAKVLRFQKARVERDGFSAEAHGTLAELDTNCRIAIEGDLTYDLSKLEPKLKSLLGRTSAVAGKDHRPFQLSGTLSEPTVAVGGQPSSPLSRMNGNAAVAWQSLKAYGFDVGPAELKADVEKGAVRLSPVEATFGQGKVRVRPTLDLASPTYDLSFDKGRAIEKAKLTPEACAEAIGFALPPLAGVAKADGLISFDLDENKIPLVDPASGTVKGKITLHDVVVTSGPLLKDLEGFMGLKPANLQLAKEQVVPVRLEKGRVYHENLSLAFGRTIVKTSGSVGTDGTLSLKIAMPIPPRLLEGPLAKNPHIRDALLARTIVIEAGGTLNQPRLDFRAAESHVADLVRDSLKDAAKSATDDLIKKGEDKLREELRKKLGLPGKK